MNNFNFNTFIEPYKEALIKSGETRLNYYEYVLNKLHSLNKPITVIETGTMWNGLEDNQGAFTLVFADFIKNHTGGKLITVDISEKHMNNCKQFTKEYSDVIEYVVSDSVSYLESLSNDFVKNIDFIFFDSYDLNLVDPLPSEIHHLRELLAVYNRLSNNVILAVDDNLMPGHWIEWLMVDQNKNVLSTTIVTAENEIIGKGTLIDRFLRDNGWKRSNDNLSSCLLGYERN
jgi:hypothetical protein